MSSIKDRFKAAKKSEGKKLTSLTPFIEWHEGEERFLICVGADPKKKYGTAKKKQVAIRFMDQEEKEWITTSHVIVTAWKRELLKPGEMYAIIHTEVKSSDNGFPYKDFEIIHYPNE